jgi:hypothetical protein
LASGPWLARRAWAVAQRYAVCTGRCFLGRTGSQLRGRRVWLARAAAASRASSPPYAVHGHGRVCQAAPVLRGFPALRVRARITTPSSGQTTAGGLVLFGEHRSRRCLPLMSNVSRHVQQSCQANGSAVKRRVVLRECAGGRSTVGSRKAQLAQRLYRAVRPAAAGAPIVEAPPEQRPASCRAVRPSAASAPVRKRERKFGGLRRHGKESSARRATLVLHPGPASTQRLHCFVLAPRPASSMRPMPAAVWVAFVACKSRKRCAVATIVLSASKTP